MLTGSATRSLRKLNSRAFTLIELLIVVGIIAILAAIAIPNMLEAQIRAKVARVRSDLRTLATGLEVYTVDANRPPSDVSTVAGRQHIGWATALNALTTPIAYLTSVPGDVFQDPDMKTQVAAASTTFFLDEPAKARHSYDYCTYEWSGYDATTGGYTPQWTKRFGQARWEVGSCGPDNDFDNGQAPGAAGYGLGPSYDPTNGTISLGDVYRSQALPQV